MCTWENRRTERLTFSKAFPVRWRVFSQGLRIPRWVGVCSGKRAPLELIVLLPLHDKWCVFISSCWAMLDVLIWSGPKSKRIQFSPCTFLWNSYPVLSGRLNGDKAGRTPGKYTSRLQVAPPGNYRAFVLMGTLAKSGCFGKPETTAAKKGMLPAAAHLQTSEAQEPNATNLGKGRMSRRLPLKPDDLPRSAVGINVCCFSLLTSTPCCALWGESCALVSTALSSSSHAAHRQRS